jgi:hypothetical protein
MGETANGRISNAFGWLYFGLLTAIAVAALPVVIVTGGSI